MTEKTVFEKNLFGEAEADLADEAKAAGAGDAASARPIADKSRRRARGVQSGRAVRPGSVDGGGFSADAAKAEEAAGLVSVIVPMPQTEPYSYAVPKSLLKTLPQIILSNDKNIGICNELDYSDAIKDREIGEENTVSSSESSSGGLNRDRTGNKDSVSSDLSRGKSAEEKRSRGSTAALSPISENDKQPQHQTEEKNSGAADKQDADSVSSDAGRCDAAGDRAVRDSKTENTPALPAGTFVRVPLGGRMVAGIAVSDKPLPVAAGKLRFVDKIFDCPPLGLEFLQFIRFAADYTMSPIGMIARMVLCVPAALEPPEALAALQWTGRRPDKITPARARVLETAANCPTWTRAGLAYAAGVSAGVIDGLRAQGIFTDAALPPEPAVPLPQADFAPPKLSEGQKQAAELLCQAVSENKFSVSLLEGVTGSGKTEVYFEAVAAALRQGRQVLVLLPEIALTQQMLARFEARFGAPPAAWHSDITPQRREKIWRQAAEGRIRIVAGARSALFLPFRELGLIIADEEHDPSYKQEERVFYNARDMAVARGRFTDIPVILSSATPAVESLVNVLQGRYRPVHLPLRFGAGMLPKINLVDMRKTPPPKGQFLAEPLTRAMAETLAKGEQSLLFLNRRGYAPLTLCRACGHRFSCPDCSAWLVEHKGRFGQPKQLVCHHCDYHCPVPEACPECGALDHLVPVGPGVERIAEEAAKLFPDARLLVLSADTAQSVKQMRAELEAVIRGEVDIVIGTQLVAKGHHFPKMTCVGVVDADVGLNNGDLRAGERSLQLLSQVTGRAGREVAQSRAFIQTYQPDHPAIRALARGDGQAFIRREIEERAAYHLPPFGQLAAIIISAEEREEAENHARTLRRCAPDAAGISVLGPAEAPLARLRGRWRFRLLIQAASRRLNIQAYIRAMMCAVPKPKSGTRVQIDIDPQSFL